ncbi:MAG: class C sortase [Mogibacterium sp.]|nr:class C sortase [Mogibacterium sp.]
MLRWIRNNKFTVFILMIMFAGVFLLAYPSVANWWNSFHQSTAIMTYADSVSNLDSAEYDRLWDEAVEYNKDLGETGIDWKPSQAQLERYGRMLAIDDTGIMGYIDIPEINVKLPLYHGTDETVLKDSIGHLAPTSLPVGGKNSHSALSGHRGLPSSRLFTDLDQLREGDIWTENILNRTLTYEVDQIRIVEPEDLSELLIKEGKDYSTLITCTPYGINTHRLLIRGHRIPNSQGDANMIADALQIETKYVAPAIAVPLLLILLIIFLINTRKSKAERRRRYERMIAKLDNELALYE